MYGTKEQDHAKRRNQEGSYSVYNKMYNYLLNNYEPQQIASDRDSIKRMLFNIGKDYDLKGGKNTPDEELSKTADQALDNFVSNNGKHGDTADNFGKAHANSFNTVKASLEDLKW